MPLKSPITCRGASAELMNACVCVTLQAADAARDN